MLEVKSGILKKVFEYVCPKEDKCEGCKFRSLDSLSGYEGCSAHSEGWECIYDSKRWKENKGIPEWCPFEFYDYV